MDTPILTLLNRECAIARGGRVRWFVLIVFSMLACGVAFVLSWQPLDGEALYGIAHSVLVGLLIATPPYHGGAGPSEMSFGHSYVRIITYGAIALAKVVAPARAAASISSDDRAGRLTALQMTLLRPRDIYLAKAVGPTITCIAPAAVALALMSGLLLSDPMRASEGVRLAAEALLQVLMVATVSVTCSALFRSPWAGRVVAYLMLLLALPLVWSAYCWWCGGIGAGVARGESIDAWTEQSFNACVSAQFRFTAGVCLLAYLVGVSRLMPTGLRGYLRGAAANGRAAVGWARGLRGPAPGS